MPRRKTQQEFIAEACTKHGDFYDYSKVCYVNSNIKVCLICPTHREFTVKANSHLRGVGCRKCYGDRSRHSQEAILAKFREMHGDRYDYSKVVYKQSGLKVTIVCLVHGEFQQSSASHLAGHGCLKCSNEEQRSCKKDFIQKAQIQHGNKYDYSQVQYVNRATKVTIICPEHGAFEQIPSNHLRGSNCPECAKVLASLAQFKFEDDNIVYPSIKHACKELGKDYWVVLARLHKGWTLDQALDKEAHFNQYVFEVNGVIYKSIGDAVRQLKSPVTDSTVYNRLAAGMSPEEALFTPRRFGHENGAIYVVTNLINGKQYVGLTTTSLKERWERHLEQVLRSNASLIHKAIALSGKENFTIEIIEQAPSIKELRAKEREWIQKLNTLAPNGYNVTLGGEVGGFPGKPTRLPGDPKLYPSVKAAAIALSQRMGISEQAAKSRIRNGRIDVKKRVKNA